jgi:glycosyltransferase involved in cell wall biosynthesis
MSPIASILVTSFNHAKYLNSCLNSIKSSISNKIELFIIDDASADISKEVINHWVKNNRRKYLSVKTIFNKKNAGISQCLSEFTYAAKADILLPLASDDMYILETVDERVRFLTNNPDIWVGFSDARAINTDGNVINQSLYKYYKHQFADCSYEVLKKELILNWNYPANIQFWRKGDWINEISPGKFSEDVEIALAALSKNKIKYLNKVLYQYRCANWPIEAKGCEKTKRLHLSYYYRKEAEKAWGISKYALQKLSDYNQILANGDVKQAKKVEKKIGILKKIPSIFFS